MQEQQLIAKLKELKTISPRKDWVLLTKTRLFETAVSNAPVKADVAGFWQNSLNVLLRKEFAYSFAALLVVILGMYGFMKLPVDFSKNSAASLVAENKLKDTMEIFKVKSQTLSAASKSNVKNISVAVDEVKAATKNLTETIKKDPQLVAQVALDINNNKSYLDIIASPDLKITSDDLYKTIDAQMIIDLENASLTKDQQKALEMVKELFKDEKYSSALENILLITTSK